jgi:hypothetical protein
LGFLKIRIFLRKGLDIRARQNRWVICPSGNRNSMLRSLARKRVTVIDYPDGRLSI